MAVAGTGQDAFFFVFFALLVGTLLAAEWRWRWRFPRVRRFLEALPKFPHTIAVMLMGGLCYSVTYYVNMSNVSNAFALWASLNPPELLFYGFLVSNGKHGKQHRAKSLTLFPKPILLFDAAMRSQWFYLKRLLLIILTFAFVVVVCNTVLFGILIQVGRACDVLYLSLADVLTLLACCGSPCGECWLGWTLKSNRNRLDTVAWLYVGRGPWLDRSGQRD